MKQKNVNTGIGSGPQTLNMILSNPGQPNLTLGGKSNFIEAIMIFCSNYFAIAYFIAVFTAPKRAGGQTGDGSQTDHQQLGSLNFLLQVCVFRLLCILNMLCSEAIELKTWNAK